MEPRELPKFLNRWKGTIVLWTCLTFLLLAAFVFARAPVYSTHSTVLVDRTQAPVSAPDRFFQPPEAAEALNTEINIIRSRPVIESVVDNLKLAFRPSTEKAHPLGSLRQRLRDVLVSLGLLSDHPSPREIWVSRLTRNLSVRPIVDSNIITIGFESSEARLATEVVNTITDQYIARRLSINASKGASEFYQEKLEETDAELQARRSQLDRFKRENSLNAITQSREQLVTERGDLRSRLLTTGNGLRERLTRFSERHASVTLLRQEIGAIEQGLSRINSELQRLETNESTVKDMAVLIDSLEDTLVNYQTKLEEARVRESANEGLINVRVVEYAAQPELPKNSRISLLLAGALGAFFVGLLAAALRQYLDRNIREDRQVEEILALPVYGSVGEYRP